MFKRSSPVRLGRLRLWENFLELAVLISAFSEGYREISAESFGMTPVLILAIVAAFLRRPWPIVSAVLAIVASALVLIEPVATIPIWVIAQVCLFSVALRCSRVITVSIGLVHATLLYGAAIATYGAHVFDPSVLVLPAWTIAVVATGMALRINYDYVTALKKTARAAVTQRDADIARHIGEERLRIARDLHDSVAHTVSVVAVHAGAAERQLERDPERARQSLKEVRSAARTVTEELQSILKVLRSLQRDSESDEFTFQSDVSSLIDTAQKAGLRINAVQDSLDGLDAAVAVAVYRIVQECLTNALRYGTGEASLRVERSAHQINIFMDNPVNKTSQDASNPGFGLIGMSERALSVNGIVSAQRNGDVFSVHAELPLTQQKRLS